MAFSKIKVLLAVPDLQDLGVQHDVRCLMRHWDRDRFEPIMLLHKRTGAFADQFPPEMASVQVDERIPDVRGARVALRLLGYARVFRELRPDAVISFVPYPNLACAWARPLSGRDFGLAVSEHAHVSASMRDPESFSGWFLWLYRRTFPRVYNRGCDLVKCISQESQDDLIKNHGILSERTRLIYNPIEIEEVRQLSQAAPEHPWFEGETRSRIPVIVNIGRLRWQKRQDVLLRAFALVRKSRPVRLALIGRGSQQTPLEALAETLGVREDVAFLGFQRNPWRFLGRACMLVVSSEWEGLPCVITEAMALSTPVVSTRCPSGPTEMLLDGAAGRLCQVGDAEDLARAIVETLEDGPAARRRATTATDHLHRFEPARITRSYEALAEELASLAAARRNSRS